MFEKFLTYYTRKTIINQFVELVEIYSWSEQKIRMVKVILQLKKNHGKEKKSITVKMDIDFRSLYLSYKLIYTHLCFFFTIPILGILSSVWFLSISIFYAKKYLIFFIIIIIIFLIILLCVQRNMTVDGKRECKSRQISRNLLLWKGKINWLGAGVVDPQKGGWLGVSSKKRNT